VLTSNIFFASNGNSVYLCDINQGGFYTWSLSKALTQTCVPMTQDIADCYTDFGHMVTRLKDAVADASLPIYHMLLVLGSKYEQRLPKENMTLSEYTRKSEYRKKKQD